jgi:hypothetical protein
MATTPGFLAFAGGTSAPDPWSRTDRRAATNRLSVPWRASGSGGTPPSVRPIDESNPWAGVMAMRLHRAAMAPWPPERVRAPNSRA